MSGEGERERGRKRGKWKQQHHCAYLHQQQSLCWCRRYSHFLGGEALFLRYGYADNVCIISARASARSTIARTSSPLRFWLAHAHIYTLCMFVCFLFFFPSLFISLSITETNSCVEYDYERQRCACMCMQATRFSTSCFSFLLPSSSFFFFYSSISFLLPSRKTHTQTQRVER